MLLEMNLEIDNPHQCEVVIKKMFQVVFLSRLRPDGTRQVDVYTALLLSCAETKFLRLNITQKVGGVNPSALLDVSGAFLARDDVLKQFWGAGTAALNRVGDVLPYVSKSALTKAVTGALIRRWPKLETNTRPLLVREPEKSIGPMLVFPLRPTLQEGQAVLDLAHTQAGESLRSAGVDVVTGVWLHARFTSDSDSHHEVVEFEHRFECKAPSRVEELRVYYCCPPHCEVTDQNGHVLTAASRSAEKHTDEIPTELYKVYSQAKTKYFDDWIRLGIVRGTLLRVHPSAALEDALTSHHLHGLMLQFRATDVDITRRREVRALLTSIWLAAILAVGVDWTRLDAAKDSFPLESGLTGTFWWLLMCACLIPALLGGAEVRNQRVLFVVRALCVCSFGGWFALSFLLYPGLRDTVQLRHWLRYLPFVVVSSGIFVFAVQAIRRWRTRS